MNIELIPLLNKEAEQQHVTPNVESYYTNDQSVNTSTKTSKTYHMLFGLVKTETNNDNKTTSYSYDKLGRVTRITTPGFTNLDDLYYPVSQYYNYYEGYSSFGYITSPYSGIYGTMVYSYTLYGNGVYNGKYEVYDAYGNLRYVAEGNEYHEENIIVKSQYEYDLMQRVIASKDAEGNIMTQSYNPWRQVKEGVDASGNLHVNDYDFKNNKVASYLVAKDNVASYRANTYSNTYKEDYREVSLDQFGRTTERSVYKNWPTQSGKLSELYRYDISGNIISYTDPKKNINENGFTNTYSYDELNQLTEVKNALNQITTINYTILGGIKTVTMKENVGSTTPITLYSKSYDELGRLQSKADSSGQVTNYSYNTIGLNSKTIDRNRSIISAKYDGLYQLNETTIESADHSTSMGHIYNYTNPYGYSGEVLLENGGFKAFSYYTYDEFGQITQKNITGSDIVNSNLKLQYNSNGRMKSIGAGVGDSNYFYTNYSYNKDRLEKVQTNGQQTASTSDSDYALYQYYADGKLKKITYPKLNDNTYLTTEYLYDALGRMTAMSNKKGDTVLSQFTYTYDANGNILSINDGKITKTYTYDKLNRLKSIQTPSGNEIVYTYDLRGNRKTSNNSKDSSNIQNTSYSYDLENKLKAVTKGTSTTAMTYYADGYRAKKTTGSNSTSYIYNLAGKVVSTETTKNGSTTRDNYVWGPDRVLAGSKVGGEGYYYLYNGHGDVIQIVDRNGNVVNNYKYDEWGNIEVSNETIDNLFKYAGEVYDNETGLYYLRARYYDTSLGRFINEDSVEGQVDNPLTLNLYSYCLNNPIIYIDPSGHEYGYVRDFVSDYSGEVEFGTETVGWQITITSPNGKQETKTVYSKNQPYYYTVEGTTVSYQAIVVPYADITIGDKTQRFYYYAPDYSKMQRTDFLDNMGIKYSETKTKSIIVTEQNAKYANFMIANAIGIPVCIMTEGASRVVSIIATITCNAATTFGETIQSGTYKIKSITAYINYGYGKVAVPVIIIKDPKGKISTSQIYLD